MICHAQREREKIRLEEQAIGVLVADLGAGISDIGEAMQEEYSTIPPFAKKIG